MFLGLLLPVKKKPKLSDVSADRFLRNISTKDSKWDEHRENSCTVADHYRETGYENYPRRIDECATRLSFDRILGDDGNPKLRLRAAKFCRVRFCPVCQWRKALMWTGRFKKYLPKILQDHPKHRFIFLTLTIKNCPLEELRATIAEMNVGWKRFTKRKTFPAVGFVKTLEVTKGDDGSAHPHFHCLLMVTNNYFSRNYLSQSAWTDMWQDCMRLPYKPIVNIKTIKPKKGTELLGTEAALLSAISETLKYSVKEADLISEAHWLDLLTEQMHKIRTVALGGIFKQYMSEEDPEDLIHGEDEEPEIEIVLDEEDILIFDWFQDHKKYVKRSTGN